MHIFGIFSIVLTAVLAITISVLIFKDSKIQKKEERLNQSTLPSPRYPASEHDRQLTLKYIIPKDSQGSKTTLFHHEKDVR